MVLLAQERCRAVPPWDADLSEMREVVETFEARDYKPPVWARNAHLHTIVASGDMEKKILGDRIASESFQKPLYQQQYTSVHTSYTINCVLCSGPESARKATDVVTNGVLHAANFEVMRSFLERKYLDRSE